MSDLYSSTGYVLTLLLQWACCLLNWALVTYLAWAVLGLWGAFAVALWGSHVCSGKAAEHLEDMRALDTYRAYISLN